MALATQCPHCGTTFRVAHDQLKLRAGLVRCGACKEIFNGIEHLLHAAEAVAQAAAEAAQLATPPPPAIETPTQHPVSEELPATEAGPPAHDAIRVPATEPDLDADADADADADPEVEPATEEAEVQDAPEHATPITESSNFAPANRPPDVDDPLQRMTLMDFAPHRRAWSTDTADLPETAGINDGADQPAGNEPDEIDRAIDELQRRPLRRSRSVPKTNTKADVADTANPADEPAFVLRARQQQLGGRRRQALLAALCFFLMLGALAQTAFAFRSQISAHFPPAKPIFGSICAALACRIDLPTQIENVTIESNELQVMTPNQNTFVLKLLLRNHGSIVGAWPHIELTLNNASEQALVRRVFLPREYLPTSLSESHGFAANAEQALQIHFKLATPKAAGYRVYLFYP